MGPNVKNHRQYLYIIDPIASLLPDKDTTFAFMLESQARHIDTWYCLIQDISVENGLGYVNAQKVKVKRPTNSSPNHYTVQQSAKLSFDDFDVIWMRKDPPVDLTFLTASMLLDFHHPKKTLVLNHPRSIQVVNEKLWGLSSGLMPPSVVSSNIDMIVDTVNQFSKAVLKPLYGAGGAGIMVFDKNDGNLCSAIDLLTDFGRRPIIVQKYLPEARQGDKRLILLGGNPIGALLRVPKASDHRANIHIGGTVKHAEITERDQEIADTLRPHLLRLGLHFVGLDIIGGYVTEINVTSPTGIQEINRLNQLDGKKRLESQVMDYVERLLENL